MSRLAILLAVATVCASAVTGAQTPTGFDLTLVDLDGTRAALGRVPRSVFAPRVSPDGRRVAFEMREPAGPDGSTIWIADLADIGARRALPNVVGPLNWAPMWSSDGERIVFAAPN